MPKRPDYTPELIAQIRTWTAGCGSWVEARDLLAKRLGVHRDNVTRAHRLKGPFWEAPAGSVPPPASERPSGTRGLVDAPFDAAVETSTAATLEEVVQLVKVDLDVWEPRGFSVTRKKHGFGWNARFSRRPEAANRRVIEDLKADLLNRAISVSPPPVAHKIASSTGALLVVGVLDAHLGKLSWSEESGHNYDLKIAKEAYLRAIHDLVAKARQYGAPIKRILFPVGNDYMTCDSDKNETTAGTLQSVDGRFPKIYREGRKLLCDAIEYLRQIAPVDVVVVPGNHDRASMFHMGDALECWFHGYSDVTVDNRWVWRKYYPFGNTVFGLTHGDTIKQDKLPLAGAVEESELWARCKRRVWLLGHYHHWQIKEYMGVRVQVLPSISGSDSYHEQNGYIGATRSSVAMICSDQGVEATFESEPEN